MKKRLKNKWSKIKFSAKYRNVENEYDKLMTSQAKLKELYGMKEVIKPSDRLRKKMSEQSKKYVEKRKLSCTPIDLKNDQNKKIYNQFDKGWCYAFSTADLISQHAGKDVSRVHLSVMYNKHDFLNGFQNQVSSSVSLVEGGFAMSALNIAKSNGLCFEEDLPSSPELFGNEYSTMHDTATGNAHIRQVLSNQGFDENNQERFLR